MSRYLTGSCSGLSTLLPSQRVLKVLRILVFCKLLALFTFTCETQTPKEKGAFDLRNGEHGCTSVLGTLSDFCTCEALELGFLR